MRAGWVLWKYWFRGAIGVRATCASLSRRAFPSRPNKVAELNLRFEVGDVVLL